jgi:hypothetical protein
MEAMRIAAAGIVDPAIGAIGIKHAQICPQNYGGGCIREDTLDALMEAFPDTVFRLHANVRLLEKGCPFDAGTAFFYPDYYRALVRILRHIGQPYSLHGSNKTPLRQQMGILRRLEDDAGVPVALEGLYPSPARDVWDWRWYAELGLSGFNFALDLSHLNIVVKQTGEMQMDLVKDLLESPHCIEVHVSGNDGVHDRHLPCSEDEWWLSLLDSVHSVLFYEGNLCQA